MTGSMARNRARTRRRSHRIWCGRRGVVAVDSSRVGPMERPTALSRCPRSPRRAARWRRRLAAQQLKQLVVGVSSWVSLGRPSRYRVALAPPSSPAHARALAHIENSALRWIRLTESAEDLVSSGRRGRAIADQLAALGGWLHAHRLHVLGAKQAENAT